MSVDVSLIAAVGKNRELGAKNDLLWHLPDDFAWFVRNTKGHPVIMGRKTMESLGRPLRNRRNLVITRNPNIQAPEGFEIFRTLENAMQSALETEKEEIFIIGGGEIYKQSMDIATKLYITQVNGDFPDADTWFPEYGKEWQPVFTEKHPADERHAYSFEYQVLERKAIPGS